MASADAAGPTELPLAQCRLDLAGLREQRERYRALGGQVRSIERHEDRLEIGFGADLDRDLLERTLATERECCPFFGLDYDPERRRLEVTVERPEQRPALAAIAYALTGS